MKFDEYDKSGYCMENEIRSDRIGDVIIALMAYAGFFWLLIERIGQ